MESTNIMNKSSMRGISLSVVILFSIAIILSPLNVYAEKIDVKSIGLGETSIITLTNESIQEIKTLKIWLGENANFKSFKTEKGWVGEKNSLGVIIFTSSETIKKDQSVKFGIKSDKENQSVNWKILDKNNEIIKTGIIKPTQLISVKENPDLEINNKLNNNGEIFTSSTFKIIPNKPNTGSTIRVVGENFGVSQNYDFYIDSNKIGEFYTNEQGNFITTMDIPDMEINDRINLKIKNNLGEEKVVSIRLGENENRIVGSEKIKFTIEGISNIVYRGEQLELHGTAAPNSSITIEIKNPEKKTIVTRTTQVDSKGNWELPNPINISYDTILGQYSTILSDGRNQILKNWVIETDKVIQINPTKKMFEAGELMKFNGTALPNKSIQLILENSLGEELTLESFQTGETGKVEFEYQTIENENKVGTWTLIATQDEHKEYIFVGYDIFPIIPTLLEFNKINYKTGELATIQFAGEPSSKIKMIIVSPTGNVNAEEISIQLRPDGKGIYELDLEGYISGTYTAVIKKDNFQTSEKFSVGLQLGSGQIDAKLTETSYLLGDKILLLGNTNQNVLLTGTLLDPSGKQVRTLQMSSNNLGAFSEDRFRIPPNSDIGLWRLTIESGANLEVIEFDVFMKNEQGMTVKVIDGVEIPGFGKNIKIDITATHKTLIEIEISDQNGMIIDDSLTCNTTSDFKCEILWTIPKDFPPGTYLVKVKDSISSNETTFEIGYE